MAIALVIETLRRDGHCVTHAADAQSAIPDLVHRDYHLLITGSNIDRVPRSDLIGELRERSPAMPMLCLTKATRRPTARSRPGFHALREPFTAEELRAAVGSLLPELRLGSILARRTETVPPSFPERTGYACWSD